MPQFCCLTRQPILTSSLADLTPLELADAATQVRHFFTSLQFQEVLLNPFDAYPIDYQNDVIDVAGIGQLRFNTEPEIWQAQKRSDYFYSISHLFRKESEVNVLRRSSFIIIDFYRPGSPNDLLAVFRTLLKHLANGGLTKRLSELPFDVANYDSITDGPKLTSFATRWVVTCGYDTAHSFFEVNDNGESTRAELFLVTPTGYLEVAAMGVAGWNRNPKYILRNEPNAIPKPPVKLSGFGFGFERLLLAERILLRHQS